MSDTISIPATKFCTGCGETKSSADFYIHKRNWLSSRCKPCHIAQTRAYQARRVSQSREYQARYRAENRDKCIALQAAWRERNPDAGRRWRLANIEKTRESAIRGGHAYRARMRGATPVPITADQLASRLAYYAYRCWVCREPYEAIDHVKPLSQGGAHMLCNLRPICKPCNSSKCAQWPFDVEAFRLARATKAA